MTLDAVPPSALRLSDSPDWLYLLREFEALYRQGSAGGSSKIRSHRRRVREALSRIISADPALSQRGPIDKPVTVHFGRALDLGERAAMQGMARALREVRDRLTWEYGYDKVPKTLARRYAYCEVLGPNGPVPCADLILGFVLFAPKTTYPQHSHKGISESYISIAGSWSENDAAVYAPGSLILNGSGDEHRITTGDLDPCLLAYAWAGGADALADPKMSFTKPRAPKA